MAASLQGPAASLRVAGGSEVLLEVPAAEVPAEVTTAEVTTAAPVAAVGTGGEVPARVAAVSAAYQLVYDMLRERCYPV